MRILRIVGSGMLSCGCFVGIYETYGAAIARIIDQPGDDCPFGSHCAGAVVDRAVVPDVATPVPAGEARAEPSSALTRGSGPGAP